MTSIASSFVFQEESGWCGVAVVTMILSAVGIIKSQVDIADDIYLSWWGTTHDTLLAYLSRYFLNVTMKEQCSFQELVSCLNKNKGIIVNWFDNLDAEDEEGGHYSIALGYDDQTGLLQLADPSTARKGIWEMNKEEFIKRWFDYMDINNTIKISGWMLVVDMSSKK